MKGCIWKWETACTIKKGTKTMDGNVEDMCNAKCGRRRRHTTEEQWIIMIEGATKVMNAFKWELHALKPKHKDIIESKVGYLRMPNVQTIAILELEEE